MEKSLEQQLEAARNHIEHHLEVIESLLKKNEQLKERADAAENKLQELLEENFKLSAGVCEHLRAGPYGHGTCAAREQLDLMRRALDRVRERLESRPASDPGVSVERYLRSTMLNAGVSVERRAEEGAGPCGDTSGIGPCPGVEGDSGCGWCENYKPEED